MTDYVAKRTLYAPGTAVAGYQPGHQVDESVVEAWGLKLGVDVAEGTELPVEAGTPMQRPGPEDVRATWERWAVANGMSADDAAVAAQDALEKTGQPQAERPADSAKKSEWVDYALARGADEDWARADTTTKADLQAYEPATGDTVAMAATEANQA